MFERRLVDRPLPSGYWTDVPHLRDYRYTCPFRVADRVSQYLVREVQYGSPEQSPDEVFFRTLLFKFFNRESTWELLSDHLGPLQAKTFDLDRYAQVLDEARAKGKVIYNSAYVTKAQYQLVYDRDHGSKHRGLLFMLRRMLEDRLPSKLAEAPTYRDAFQLLALYPFASGFYGMQWLTDLDYSTLLNFSEDDFVEAGPGAVDGIRKIFGKADPLGVLKEIVANQEGLFRELGFVPVRLDGYRPLSLMDVQNCFCEIAKVFR